MIEGQRSFLNLNLISAIIFNKHRLCEYFAKFYLVDAVSNLHTG